jgi:hypothetical protein
MTVVQSEESVKIGLFFERYEKKHFRKYILSVQDAYQDACGVAVGRDAVRRFRHSGWFPAGYEPVFPGSIFDVDVSHSRPASRTEDTSTPDPRFAIAFPRRARKCSRMQKRKTKRGKQRQSAASGT